MPVPDDCLSGRNGLADVVTADRRGAIEIFYSVPSGQAFRDLHLAYGDGLFPVTHTMIAVGNTTNRSAAATYVQDLPAS